MRLDFGKIKCPRCGAGPKKLRVAGAFANCTCPAGHSWRHFSKREEPVEASAEKD
jgi:hypothetical protein